MARIFLLHHQLYAIFVMRKDILHGVVQRGLRSIKFLPYLIFLDFFRILNLFVLQSARKMGESSTPRTFDNKNRSSRGTKSVPRDFGKGQRKKNLLYEERWNMTTGKSKIKGGWIVDDPGDLPRKKFRAHDYASPMTSRKKSHRNYSIGFSGHSSNSNTRKKWKCHTGTSGSQ